MNAMITLLTMTTLVYVISPSNQLPRKPDLVLADIQYSLESQERVADNYFFVGFEPCPTYAEFTIRIENIGRQDYSGPIYLSWTDNDYEIRTGVYSHGQSVNQEGKIIPPGGYLNVRIKGPMYSTRTIVRFNIHAGGSPTSGSNLPEIDEIYLDNNSYDLTVEVK